jgi:uncharacterized ferritin-like protein (DUF455 family)
VSAEQDLTIAPPDGTVERWAWNYILATTIGAKLEGGTVPTAWEHAPPVRKLLSPGRPSCLSVVAKAKKTRGLQSPHGRARALHTFFHHELQATELMAWAVLAYPNAPLEFRLGLTKIALDEIRHMQMYATEIERLGYRIGDFPVRDWFWARVPSAVDPASFVACMGLGFESANLEHTVSYAAQFRAAGDERGARVQELIGREELAHVRFGVRWFEHFRGALDFETWVKALPPPLSPLLMRGQPLQREARQRAGQPEPFLDELTAWKPADAPGS